MFIFKGRTQHTQPRTFISKMPIICVCLKGTITQPAQNFLYFLEKIKALHFRCVLNMVLLPSSNLYFSVFHNIFCVLDQPMFFIFREIFILFTPILLLFHLQKDFKDQCFNETFFVVLLCYFGNIQLTNPQTFLLLQK